MNKYFQINESKNKTRKSLTEDDLDEWRKIKDSSTELVNFFKFEAKTKATSVNAWITSTPENTLVSPATDNATCSSNEMHNITSSEEEKTDEISDESDISSILPRHVKNMLQQFEFTCDDISCLFTEDVTNCQTFMAGMNNLATKYFEFDLMYSKYKSQTLNPRNTSKLRQNIEQSPGDKRFLCTTKRTQWNYP